MSLDPERLHHFRVPSRGTSLEVNLVGLVEGRCRRAEEGVMRTLVVMVLVALCVNTSVTHAQPHQVNPVAHANAGFQKRMQEYLKLRGELTKKIPEVSETGDPAKINAREKALGAAIAAARKGAKPGDIFGADMVPLFTQIIATDWKHRSRIDRKAVFEEVPAGTRVTINQPYPTTLPLLTVPPNLLVNLPMLPDELEYRLVDRHLLLRDRDANLIVDALFNVLPRGET